LVRNVLEAGRILSISDSKEFLKKTPKVASPEGQVSNQAGKKRLVEGGDARYSIKPLATPLKQEDQPTGEPKYRLPQKKKNSRAHRNYPHKGINFTVAPGNRAPENLTKKRGKSNSIRKGKAKKQQRPPREL